MLDGSTNDVHVEQLSVVPAWQGRGLGRALRERAGDWARARGRSALTLTTFSDVPCNPPLYERLGFQVVAESEITPELRERRARTASQGPDPSDRVCMRRELMEGWRTMPSHGGDERAVEGEGKG